MNNESVENLDLVVSADSRWAEAAHEIAYGRWGIAEQAEYYGVRIADAVVLGRTTLEKVSARLVVASNLNRQAEEFAEESVQGDIFGLTDENLIEAVARRLSYRSFREGKRRTKNEKRLKLHRISYNRRQRILHAANNVGLARLEARDLHLDNMWYDEEEA